ncbi:hypothetical protein CSHISOI_04981 [Colletotrichum shisoi]|uniref:Uncharacterized protein n=1 Tax=Colletotrichum shisoi TaxID=2078593 RepID=A0A5Q4BWB2_9PEZI|nr:hypothetical protein CSHISOI_04981 [Colletotrichum shisoi]
MTDSNVVEEALYQETFVAHPWREGTGRCREGSCCRICATSAYLGCAMGGECDGQPDQTSVRLRDRAAETFAGRTTRAGGCLLAGMALRRSLELALGRLLNGGPLGGGESKANDLEIEDAR